MKKFLFLVILLIAVGFRLYLLSSVPPSASLDEASIGWNAYSILHTGRDEYGNFLPILLRAYDDYRPALYVYTVIPFIQLFGLTVFAVRLPSVLFSIATVIMSFFLTRSMLAQHKKRDLLGFLVMLLLSVSPMSVYISRLGHEVNLGLFLVVLGSLLFFLGLEKRKGIFFISSLVVYAIGFYSYQTEKIFIPLFLVSLAIFYFKELKPYIKSISVGIILAFFIALPAVLTTLTPQGMLRFSGSSVFITTPQDAEANAQQLLTATKSHNILGEVTYNRRFIAVKTFLQNYLSHFNPVWLFGYNSSGESFKAPGTGLFYLWEAPFLFLAIIIFFLKKDIPFQVKMTICSWILIAFIAPGISKPAPHALRSLVVLPMPQILIAYGLFSFFIFLRKYTTKTIAVAALFLIGIIFTQEVTAFAHGYFVDFPIKDSKSFQYALKPVMQYVQQYKDKNKEIIISNTDLVSGDDADRNNFNQSYMFYLFYSKYDPKRYLTLGGTKSGGFGQPHQIDNITFRAIDWKNEHEEHALYVGNPNDFPSVIAPVFISHYLDGSIGIKIISK